MLISAAERLGRGDTNVFWDLDRAAVRVAQEGFPAASRLYRTAGVYQKSAHAPVRDAMGEVAGILTVEGDADFFGALAALRRGALVTEVAVMLFLAAMGAQLWRLQAGMARARAAAWRAEELAAMGRMTAAIAHEIRNPLGIIRGAAQHLAARLRDGRDRRRTGRADPRRGGPARPHPVRLSDVRQGGRGRARSGRPGAAGAPHGASRGDGTGADRRAV